MKLVTQIGEVKALLKNFVKSIGHNRTVPTASDLKSCAFGAAVKGCGNPCLRN